MNNELKRAIRMSIEISTAPTGRGNEFGAGVRVLTEPIGDVPEAVGATWTGICLAVNDYMRSRGVPDFDCTKCVLAPLGLDTRTAVQVAHDGVLRSIEKLAAMDPAAHTPEGALLSGLVAAVEVYEKVRFPIGGSDE